MKKFIYALYFAVVALGFAACDDDDPKTVEPETPVTPTPDPDPEPEPEPEPEPTDPDDVTESLGAYILNQGNYYSQIEGSLDYLQYDGYAISRNIFQEANGKSLGSTPQCGIAYGDYLYLGIYESNVLWVVDRSDYTIVKQIECTQPRSIVALDGKVYISQYDGHVARLDTETLAIDATVEVGPNPETMAILNGYLYVPNSDGMNWEAGYANGKSVSKIDLSSFAVSATIEAALNPTKCASNGSDLFLLCMGDYNEVPATIYKLSSDNFEEVCAGTLFACDASNLYVINDPYYGYGTEYYRWSLSSGEKSSLLAEEPTNGLAAGIAVDPFNGDLAITYYSMDGGYASYSTDGFVNLYDNAGNALKIDQTVGIAPCGIFFNLK